MAGGFIYYLSKSSVKIEIASGKVIDYQIGNIDKNGIATLDKKVVDHIDIFGKYLLSPLSIDSKKKFHCIIPILTIMDNKGTIWSLLSTKYYLDFPIIFISSKGDTLNSLWSMELKVKRDYLYIQVHLPLTQFINKKVPICDPSYIKPCMIKRN